MTQGYIAAIDIGTNSFHLLIAKVNQNDFEVVYRERHVLRLRESSDACPHTISNQKIIEAVQLLIKFKNHCENYNAQIFAVATSAVRDALNQEEVIKVISEKTGIQINILTGDEEAEIVYLAALYKKNIKDKNVLVFDLGGGSTEFILGRNQKILYKTSLQMGAVRFMQKYFDNYCITENQLIKMQEEVVNILKPIKPTIMEIGFELCLGIGGTITSLSWLIDESIYQNNHCFNILNDYRITRKDFNVIKQRILENKEAEDRKNIPGMEPKRADVIPAGIIIVDEIFSSFELEYIIAPGYSIKEGVILYAITSLAKGTVK